MIDSYRVLLVDDEPLALAGIKTSVNWEELGYSLSGECGDGEEALLFIKEHAPDLVITDLRMPVLDGLGLIEQVVKYINPTTKFIIVSGYNDFVYAQKALQYEVHHYLLKPVFSEEVTEALLEIRQELGSINLHARINHNMLDKDNKLGGDEQQERESPKFSRIFEEDSLHLFKVVSYVETTITAMEEFKLDKIESSIDSAFAFFQNQQLSPEVARMFLLNLVYHSNRVIREMNGSPTAFQKQHQINRLLQQTTTIETIKRLLKEYFRRYCLYLNELRERNSQITIYQIEEYIKRNFRRKLTIKEIAEVFYLHPAYIGQIFVKTFGVSFHEYIHHLRINEAKRLINQDAVKFHEIAEEVGYNNYHSFLENFKKHTGLKPVEYVSRTVNVPS